MSEAGVRAGGRRLRPRNRGLASGSSLLCCTAGVSLSTTLCPLFGGTWPGVRGSASSPAADDTDTDQPPDEDTAEDISGTGAPYWSQSTLTVGSNYAAQRGPQYPFPAGMGDWRSKAEDELWRTELLDPSGPGGGLVTPAFAKHFNVTLPEPLQMRDPANEFPDRTQDPAFRAELDMSPKGVRAETRQYRDQKKKAWKDCAFNLYGVPAVQDLDARRPVVCYPVGWDWTRKVDTYENSKEGLPGLAAVVDAVEHLYYEAGRFTLAIRKGFGHSGDDMLQSIDEWEKIHQEGKSHQGANPRNTTSAPRDDDTDPDQKVLHCFPDKLSYFDSKGRCVFRDVEGKYLIGYRNPGYLQVQNWREAVKYQDAKVAEGLHENKWDRANPSRYWDVYVDHTISSEEMYSVPWGGWVAVSQEALGGLAEAGVDYEQCGGNERDSQCTLNPGSALSATVVHQGAQVMELAKATKATKPKDADGDADTETKGADRTLAAFDELGQLPRDPYQEFDSEGRNYWEWAPSRTSSSLLPKAPQGFVYRYWHMASSLPLTELAAPFEYSFDGDFEAHAEFTIREAKRLGIAQEWADLVNAMYTHVSGQKALVGLKRKQVAKRFVAVCEKLGEFDLAIERIYQAAHADASQDVLGWLHANQVLLHYLHRITKNDLFVAWTKCGMHSRRLRVNQGKDPLAIHVPLRSVLRTALHQNVFGFGFGTTVWYYEEKHRQYLDEVKSYDEKSIRAVQLRDALDTMADKWKRSWRGCYFRLPDPRSAPGGVDVMLDPYAQPRDEDKKTLRQCVNATEKSVMKIPGLEWFTSADGADALAKQLKRLQEDLREDEKGLSQLLDEGDALGLPVLGHAATALPEKHTGDTRVFFTSNTHGMLRPLLDQVDEAIAYGGTADRNMPDLVVHGGDLALLDEQPQDTFSSQKGTFVDDWTGKAVDLEVEAWKQSVIARDRPGLRTSSPGIEAINDAKTQIVSDVPGDYLSPQLEANMRAFASLGSRWSRFWKTERVFVQGDHDVSLEDYAVAQKGIERKRAKAKTRTLGEGDRDSSSKREEDGKKGGDGEVTKKKKWRREEEWRLSSTEKAEADPNLRDVATKGQMYLRGGTLDMARLQSNMLNTQWTDDDRAFLWMNCVDNERHKTATSQDRFDNAVNQLTHDLDGTDVKYHTYHEIDWSAPACTALDLAKLRASKCGHWLNEYAAATHTVKRTGLQVAGTGASVFGKRHYDMHARYTGRIDALASLQRKLKSCHAVSFPEEGENSGRRVQSVDVFVAHDDLVSTAPEGTTNPMEAYFGPQVWNETRAQSAPVVFMGTRFAGPMVRLMFHEADDGEATAHFFVRSPAVGRGLNVYAPPLILDIPPKSSLQGSFRTVVANEDFFRFGGYIMEDGSFNYKEVAAGNLGLQHLEFGLRGFKFTKGDNRDALTGLDECSVSWCSSSSALEGETDCWGNKAVGDPCSCKQGEAVQLGGTLRLDGANSPKGEKGNTYYHYRCCKKPEGYDGKANFVGEKCGEQTASGSENAEKEPEPAPK